jgi:hypothetical protein
MHSLGALVQKVKSSNDRKEVLKLLAHVVDSFKTEQSTIMEKVVSKYLNELNGSASEDETDRKQTCTEYADSLITEVLNPTKGGKKKTAKNTEKKKNDYTNMSTINYNLVNVTELKQFMDDILDELFNNLVAVEELEELQKPWKFIDMQKAVKFTDKVEQYYDAMKKVKSHKASTIIAYYFAGEALFNLRNFWNEIRAGKITNLESDEFIVKNKKVYHVEANNEKKELANYVEFVQQRDSKEDEDSQQKNKNVKKPKSSSNIYAQISLYELCADFPAFKRLHVTAAFLLKCASAIHEYLKKLDKDAMERTRWTEKTGLSQPENDVSSKKILVRRSEAEAPDLSGMDDDEIVDEDFDIDMNQIDANQAKEKEYSPLPNREPIWVQRSQSPEPLPNNGNSPKSARDNKTENVKRKKKKVDESGSPILFTDSSEDSQKLLDSDSSDNSQKEQKRGNKAKSLETQKKKKRGEDDSEEDTTASPKKKAKTTSNATPPSKSPKQKSPSKVTPPNSLATKQKPFKPPRKVEK